MDKNGTSLDIRAEKLKQLALLFPEFVNSEGDIDVTLLKYLIEKPESALQSIEDNEKPTPYQLTWKGREKAFLKTLETTTKTLNPDRSNSIDFDNSENLLIEGENLQVLQALQKSYQGKVKMIYIDPPYNTGNDYFVYPDNFKENKKNYQREAGIRNEEDEIAIDSFFKKNSKDNGNYHSNWLSMMYPRLFLARNLLREDGVIFVSIDDNEQANLKLLMNQIFGEENFRNAIIIKRGAKNVQMQFETIDRLGSGYETVFMYSKNSNYRFKRFEKKLDEKKEGNWNNHWRGTDRPTMRYELFGITPDNGQWRWGKNKSMKGIENYKKLLKDISKTEETVTQQDIDDWYIKQEDEVDLLRLSKNGKPEHYIAPTDSQLSNDVWFDLPANSTSIIKSIFSSSSKIFDNPKSIDLVKRLLEFINDKDAIILDFFVGSGTTAHSVLEQNMEDGGNRKFICVQMKDTKELNGDAKKVGYNSIFDITKARIQKVVEKLKKENETKLFGTSQDLGFRTFRLSNSNFKQWNGEVNNDRDVLQLEIDHNKISNIANSPIEFMLYEILLKEGHLLTEKVEIKQAGEGNFYYLPIVNLCVVLEGWGVDMRERVADLHPKKVIILDSLFDNDDQFMSNTDIYLNGLGIELEIV